MVQPKYSPEEALQKIKLSMSYDMSKTLNENKEVMSEQYVAPAVAAGATGAAIGAGTAALTAVPAAAGGLMLAPTGAATIIPALAALGPGAGIGTMAATSIVGGAAALAVLPLVYWLATKDTGANKVKKMFEMCSSEASKIAKLPRKLNDAAFREMSDNIDDAINDTTFGVKGGTDEEKLFAQFKKFNDGTASDFCAFVKYYNSHSDSGDLFDDLDSDIDAEEEWKQIYRPIRNCVEDSLLTIKDETIKDCKQDPKQAKCKKLVKTGQTYKPCSGTYSFGCKSDVIAKVQGCLGLVADGKFGPKTKTALSGKGITTFTDADVPKICSSTKIETPKDEFTTQVDADKVDDVLNM